jgi:RNA polymerase sigma-70 factor, ECF subfamily
VTQQQHFMELYKPISGKISAYCRAITRNNAEAEDLLHDTLLTAFEKLNDLRSDTAFPSFLFSIAYNIYSKQLRRLKFRGNYNEQSALIISSKEATPELVTELTIILERMKQLPKHQYEALMLFHLSDLSVEEIQKIQGGTVSAIKQRIKRGRDNLLEMLNENEQHIAIMLLF